MNYRFVIGQLGLLLVVLSLCIGAVAVYEVIHIKWLQPSDDFAALIALGASAGIGLIFGGLLRILGKGGQQQLLRREALLLTSSTWLIGGVLAALPFWFWAMVSGDATDAPTQAFQIASADGLRVYDVQPGHEFASFMSCFFEAVSGLTTTGATVLGERGTIEGLPSALLLWRSLTHWLGGLGIVVLFVAVLPSLGVGAKRLFQTESSAQEGVRPRIGETARLLWLIYAGFTLVAMGLYLVMGMGLFDAINHAFSVMSTGGYSTRNGSIGDYDGLGIDIVTTLFMLLAGVNFILFYRIARGKWRSALEDVELRWYLFLKILGTAIIAVNLWGQPIATTGGELIAEAGAGDSLRYASFQVASLQTGTGFGTADYDLWPFLSRVVLFGLVFIGGCAGSTCGGIKVVRFIVAFKVIGQVLERSFRPSVMRPLKLGEHVIAEPAKLSAVTFLVVFMLSFAIGAITIELIEPRQEDGGRADFVTSLTASMACLCNVGPGLSEVGAIKHFGWMTGSSKFVCCILMVLGRLELYALLALFTVRFWKQD